MRAFVAVLLDDAVRAALARAVEQLRAVARDVAWVAPANFHLTLKFLGEVPETRLAELTAALAAAAAPLASFGLDVQGLGAFPSLTRPRVIWAGTGEGAPALAALAARVEAALEPLGFPPEARPWSGHVTLGRVRVPRLQPALAAALRAGAAHPFGRLAVVRVSLMQSQLARSGARYAELAAVPLAASASADVDGPPHDS